MGLFVFLTCLWLVPTAMAGPPRHPQLPEPIAGFPLNHACGITVDSKGDLYVSNAGEAKIEVFDPSGIHLTSIANAHEPCGLAVDSNGNLYVSGRANGEVVRYHPLAYPFVGIPSYEAPVVIDASGKAHGISVDSSDDSLYVAEETRVTIYEADGTFFTNDEIQTLVIPGLPTGGSYELCFEGQCVTLPYNASGAEIQAALEGLSTIGVGNVEVPSGEKITFIGALAGTDLPQLEVNAAALEGSTAEIQTRANGSDGHFGEGEFTDATGVAVYTYPASANAFKRRYVAVADSGAAEIDFYSGRFDFEPNGFLPGTLALRHAENGSDLTTHELGLAAMDAYLGVDSQNGHFYSYDAIHKVLNEFETTGQFFSQTSGASLADAMPTAIAVDRAGGAGEGDVFVTAGAETGAKLLAFGPVAAPNRKQLEPLSHSFARACGTAVDSAGNLYVAGESVIRVYDPIGTELTHIDDPHGPCFLAVDSEGNLYAADLGSHSTSGDEQVDLYVPAAYPPAAGTTYTRKVTPIETLNSPRGLAVDPANGPAKDRLFVSHGENVIEYESAADGSSLVEAHFCSLNGPNLFGVDVYGANGNVYIVNRDKITICVPSGGEVVAQITGADSPDGAFSVLNGVSIAVDQANGNVLVGNMSERGVVEEYEPSGPFVAQFGPFQKLAVSESDLALDDSGGATQGNLYVAYGAPSGFDVTAFGPLSYGEPPVTVTGTASGLGDTTATLNGTVDPRGFAVNECKFLYVTEAAYQATGFSDLSSGGEQPCTESSAEIGQGTGAVPVHAPIGGLQVGGRYRFCLLAKNKFGEAECEPGLFGPPVVTTKSVQPVLYTEATLRGTLDPTGLTTRYWFEYGPTEAYGSTTPVRTLGAGTPSGPVQVSLMGLEEGKTYHFRLVAENEDAGPNVVTGTDLAFETLQRNGPEACPNETLRAENRSVGLPDCRAYELVTPADSGGTRPGAGEGAEFNEWLVDPAGPGAGERVTFRTFGSLPDEPGNGRLEAYLASRGADGWSSEIVGPSFAQNGDSSPDQVTGVSPDQLYSAWTLGGLTLPGAFPPGSYLRTPQGFEVLGIGDLPPGLDLNAVARYIAPGANHVIFSTESVAGHTSVRLEPGAPVPPAGAIYDRTGGTTKVVSLPPVGAPPAVITKFETLTPVYEGASFDGATAAFTLGGDLFLRRDNAETIEVAEGPLSFAGISSDGKYVFYTDKLEPRDAADLYVFDVNAKTSALIAATGRFVNVSADGSHVYYAIEEAGQRKLYGWDDGAPRLVASLAATDLQQPGQLRFPGTHESDHVALDSWTADCVTSGGGIHGAGVCPSRTSPGGRYLVFQSHADLTPTYEAGGHYEVYRYDFDTEGLLCLSCDPSGTPATADSDLQSFGRQPPTEATTLVPGVTADGSEVFFQTAAALLPEDGNSVLDIYEWRADGTGSCSRAKGCLALLSSGQGDTPSQIFGETPDGHDVFFSTQEKLTGADVVGSSSIYDARVDGGFPAPTVTEPCHGDACQGEATPPPARPTVGTEVGGPGNATVPAAKKAKKHKHRKHKHHHRHHRTRRVGP